MSAAALQAWSWLKELYPAQIADFQLHETHYCLCLCDQSIGVEMDIRLDLNCFQLQFCSPVLTLPRGAEPKALAFLEWNRRLGGAQAQLRFAYAPARREIFVQGAIPLTYFQGCACMRAFLHDMLHHMAAIKQDARHLMAAGSAATGWVH